MQIFSERMKELRKDRGLKQREMAEICGVKPRGYQGYEYGRHCPEIPGLIQIAKFFDVSTDYPLGLTDKREVNR